MTSVSDEMLMRHVDGEASAEERRRIEQLAAVDPAVAARLQAAADLQERVRAAYRPVLDEPLPAALLDAIRQPSPRVASRPWLWAGLAASWLITAAAVTMAILSGGDRPYVADQGRLYAARPLAVALSDADGDETSGRLKVIFSFRTENGLCRTFVVGTEQATAGVACRERGRWRISTLAEAPPARGEAYRMAAGQLPAPILAFVDAHMAGEPLTPQQEAAARARGWSE